MVAMEIEGLIINAGITVFSLGLLLVSILSYRRYRNNKLLFVSFVFMIFFIKGVILSLGLFSQPLTEMISNPYFGLLDLIILVFLFIATLKR